MSAKQFQRDLASTEVDTLHEQVNRKSMCTLQLAIRKARTYRQFVHVLEEDMTPAAVFLSLPLRTKYDIKHPASNFPFTAFAPHNASAISSA